MKSTRLSGFTLIEMIGVLAVMAILAGMILPNIIGQINRAVEESEEMGLASLAKGLEAAVLRNRIIPGNGTDFVDSTGATGANGTVDWAEFIADQVAVPVADIITEAERGCARRYWFDPSTGAGTLLNAAVDTSSAGSYDQDVDTLPTVAPVNARAMLIADLSSGCGNSIATPTSAALFDATWQQTSGGGGLIESPTLKIERINFAQLFERITLVVNSSGLYGRDDFTNITANPAQGVLVSLPANVRVTQVYISGNFNGVTCGAGCSINASIGESATPNTIAFFGASNIFGGANLPASYIGAYALAATSNITVNLTGFTPAGATMSGYIDADVTFDANPRYQLVGQAAATQIVVAVSNITTFYVLNGSELQLSDQAAAPNLLVSKIVKESESFTFSPGPPAIWGH